MKALTQGPAKLGGGSYNGDIPIGQKGISSSRQRLDRVVVGLLVALVVVVVVVVVLVVAHFDPS